jgi:4,5-dihydroxyphthalate decarboxylase
LPLFILATLTEKNLDRFFRQLKFHEFDVSELSLSSYVLTLSSPDPPFIALPVFPSRFFRHQSIYVNSNAGIRTPTDLRGKRIGVPEFQMTAPVWQRGIMQEEYGLAVDSVEYLTGAVQPSAQPRTEKIKLDLPPNIHVTPIPAGKCLSQMLADNEIDALYSAVEPSSLRTHPHNVAHLFPNFKAVEREYYQRTGIFPIMHVVVMKRSLYAAHPWIAKSLTKAFATSLDVAYEAALERSALRYILPWLHDHVQETRECMGDRWWKDGLQDNRHVLEKFLQYSFEQGLAKRKFEVEDLFAPNTLDEFVV